MFLEAGSQIMGYKYVGFLVGACLLVMWTWPSLIWKERGRGWRRGVKRWDRERREEREKWCLFLIRELDNLIMSSLSSKFHPTLMSTHRPRLQTSSLWELWLQHMNLGKTQTFISQQPGHIYFGESSAVTMPEGWARLLSHERPCKGHHNFLNILGFTMLPAERACLSDQADVMWNITRWSTLSTHGVMRNAK